MSWIKAERRLVHSAKSVMLAQALKINEFEVIGRLVSLWTWCAENRPEARFKHAEAVLISGAAMEWTGRVDIVKAMVEVGLLDDDGAYYTVHDLDLEDLSEARNTQRERNAERQRRKREREKTAPAAAAFQESFGLKCNPEQARLLTELSEEFGKESVIELIRRAAVAGVAQPVPYISACFDTLREYGVSDYSGVASWLDQHDFGAINKNVKYALKM